MGSSYRTQIFKPGGVANLREIASEPSVDGSSILGLYKSSGLTPDGFRRRLHLGSFPHYAGDPHLSDLVQLVGERLQSYEDFSDSETRRIENGYMSKVKRTVTEFFGTPRRILDTGVKALGAATIVGAVKGVLTHQYTSPVHFDPSSIKIPFGPEISVISPDFARNMNDLQNAIGTVSDAIQGAAQGVLFLKDYAPEIAAGVVAAYVVSSLSNSISRSNSDKQIASSTVRELSEDIERYRRASSL